MEFIFTLLNIAALLGWCIALFLLILHEQRYHINDELWYEQIITILKYLEVICCVEVGRIATGQLKGNLVLGMVLHMIRISCIVFILPDGLATSPAKSMAEINTNQGYAILEQPSLSLLVLFSWCITEVTVSNLLCFSLLVVSQFYTRTYTLTPSTSTLVEISNVYLPFIKISKRYTIGSTNAYIPNRMCSRMLQCILGII